jgi:hypothetical protein
MAVKSYRWQELPQWGGNLVRHQAIWESAITPSKEQTIYTYLIGCELPDTSATRQVWASYPTDSPTVDFLRPLLLGLTSGQ